jgi:S1-C subfamily serine protease
MTTIDAFIPAIGLIVVLSQVTTISYVGRGRRRQEVRNTVTNVSYGSGFIVDGVLLGDQLRNSSTSESPIIVSVAHLIPTQGTNRYFFKLFDTITQLSKLYELNLVAYNRSSDICIFNFITPIANPMCLEWNLDDIKSGSTCYVAGFPLGDAQLSITDGVVRDPTYCFSNLATGIDQIYHSVPATNGNSGSCILDIFGRIIGIHAWGYFQTPNGITFENFCGGPSTKCAYVIVSKMLSRVQISNQKYYPRIGLGIECRIVNDIFRIIYFDNEYIKNTDGIIIDRIFQNQGATQYAIDTYNKGSQSLKISVNDMITHIFDVSQNEFIPIGYSKTSPGLVLFRNTLTSSSSFKIKIRKPPQYDVEHEITLNHLFLPETMDLNNKII